MIFKRIFYCVLLLALVTTIILRIKNPDAFGVEPQAEKSAATAPAVTLNDLPRLIQVAQESAYFQGQREALSGDVRIHFDPATKKWNWTKSCWDGGMKPIFDPALSENQSYYFQK